MIKSQENWEEFEQHVRLFIYTMLYKIYPCECGHSEMSSLHFTVLSDKLDFSLTESRLHGEKINRFCVNKSVCVTLTVLKNCALLIFVLWKTLDLSLLHVQWCFWEKETSALLGEMEIISRVESFDCVTDIFRSQGLHGFWC